MPSMYTDHPKRQLERKLSLESSDDPALWLERKMINKGLETGSRKSWPQASKWKMHVIRHSAVKILITLMTDAS